MIIKDRKKWESYTSDWNKMARDLFRKKLDKKQQEFVQLVQNNSKVSARSGHARGKDFVTCGVIAPCFLISYYPSKVVLTAPTGRQVKDVMMSEVAKTWKNATLPLGGEVLTQRVQFYDEKDWYLVGFKAADKSVEAWTGYHSPHICVIVTEASGIEDETFDAIDGILTGVVSKLVLAGNARRTRGEFYNSFRDPRYKTMTLNCLDAPNVKAKKIIIPGQVDYVWVADMVLKHSLEITEEEANPNSNDFKFKGKWHRPNDAFLVKVLGEFPEESTDQLIPLRWVEAGVARWGKRKGKGAGKLRLGVDIAGMGRDSSVYAHRRKNIIEKLDKHANIGQRQTIHMENAGRIKNILKKNKDSKAFVDTIGEGAGTHSRLIEQGAKSVSAKFSQAAKDLAGKKLVDYTGERTFKNMRAYCWWAVRDALDPKNNINLALPPDDELKEDLTAPTYTTLSNGDILIEEKKEIVKRLGRSPDEGDAVALSYFPEPPDVLVRAL